MNKVLVVVDFQNDFIDGVLGTEEAKKVVKKAAEKIRAFEGKICTTQDTHYEDYLDTQEGKNLPIIHCQIHTKGWEINDEIQDALKGKNVYSFCKSTFGSVPLARYLSESKNIDEIEIIGLDTGICDISQAILYKAFMPETLITVDSACCACVTPETHKTALDAMELCQINVINR